MIKYYCYHFYNFHLLIIIHLNLVIHLLLDIDNLIHQLIIIMYYILQGCPKKNPLCPTNFVIIEYIFISYHYLNYNLIISYRLNNINSHYYYPPYNYLIHPHITHHLYPLDQSIYH